MRDKTIVRETQSFGRYLQANRLEKGISLAEVARNTRIRKDILQMIEEEDHAHLPNEVFVKGFLRAYAGAIGVNPDEAVRLYHNRLQMINQLAQSEADLQKVGKTYWQRLLLAFSAIFGIIVLSLYLFTHFQSHSGIEANDAPAQQQVIHQDALKPADANQTPAVKSESAVTKPAIQKYILKIKAMEETWMKVTIDDREPSEYNLNAGDYLELEAGTGYELLIGNTGGVALTLNDMPVDVPGKPGQVTSVSLPQ